MPWPTLLWPALWAPPRPSLAVQTSLSGWLAGQRGSVALGGVFGQNRGRGKDAGSESALVLGPPRVRLQTDRCWSFLWEKHL